MEGLVSSIRAKRRRKWNFKRTKNSRLKICINLFRKRFIKIRFLRSSDCLLRYPLKGRDGKMMHCLHSKIKSLFKNIARLFGTRDFSRKIREAILKITDRLAIFPDRQMFRLRLSSHLLDNERESKFVSLNFVRNCPRDTLTIILNKKDEPLSADYSFSTRAISPNISNFQFQLLLFPR